MSTSTSTIPESNPPGLTTADLALFEAYFKKSQAYYSERLERFKRGTRFTFNQFAFFFGFFWFIYRKMYLELGLIIIVMIIYQLLEALILTIITGLYSRSVVYMIMQFAIPSTIGFIGNYLYLHKATRNVERAKQKFIEPDRQKKYLRRRGGVNIVFFILLSAAVASLFVYNNYLAGFGN